MAVAFGRYELLRKIASGGMGQVYLARTSSSQGFEKLVVIKRILPHLVEDEEFLTMFLDEARLSARLNHPNLVQIFELGEANHSHYLAMEYVPGEDLRRLETAARKRRQLLPVGLVCRIIADAAAGLDYAHKVKDAQGKPLGLVHRDVSPQNILVGFDGGVKLIDFGVAKAAGRVQHTATGILKGKYPYMSPEQVEGRSIDLRSDLFALGIVFWEALTSQRLFKSESDLQTMRMISDCQIAAPRQLRPELPAALDALVMKAARARPRGALPRRRARSGSRSRTSCSPSGSRRARRTWSRTCSELYGEQDRSRRRPGRARRALARTTTSTRSPARRRRSRTRRAISTQQTAEPGVRGPAHRRALRGGRLGRARDDPHRRRGAPARRRGGDRPPAAAATRRPTVAPLPADRRR